jgi:hypothetical protein
MISRRVFLKGSAAAIAAALSFSGKGKFLTKGILTGKDGDFYIRGLVILQRKIGKIAKFD